MPPLRILHISDLHQRAYYDGIPDGRKPLLQWDSEERGYVLGEKFFEALTDLSANGVDIVCFTGDLADWGHPAEYAEATLFFEKVLLAVGVPKSRFFAVPGNHDVQRKLNEDAWFELREWYLSVGDASQIGMWFRSIYGPPRGVNAARREQILQRTAAFWDWLSDFGRPDLKPSPPTLLGYRNIISPGTIGHVRVPINIIGLDSAWLCGGDDDQGRILVTQEQVQAHVRDGNNKLDGIKLALIHHPLDHLADHHEVRRLLSGDVDLLLHGHQHTPLAMTASEPGVSLRILAAGCLMEGHMGKRWPNGFHLIEIEQESVRVHFRKWASSTRFWARGSDIYQQAPDGTLHWSSNGLQKETPLGPSLYVSQLRGAIHDVLSQVPPLLRETLRSRSLLDIAVKETIKASDYGGAKQEPGESNALTSSVLPNETFHLEQVLLLEQRHWVVLGDPGSGKTTALYQFALQQYALGRVPVIFKVADLTSNSLTARLKELCDYGDSGFMEAQKAGTALLLLDGLDEVADRLQAERVMARLRSQLPKTTIIVASRYAGFRSIPGYQTLELCPLSADEQRKLLENILDPEHHERIPKVLGVLSSMRGVREMVSNPLILTLAGRLIRAGKDIPNSRAELYENVIEQLMTRSADVDEGRPTPYREVDWREALYALGWLTLGVHGNDGPIATDSFRQMVDAAPDRVRRIVDAEGGLRSFLERTAIGAGLLISNTRDLKSATAWTFAHRTFQEYCAAQGLVSTEGQNRNQYIATTLEKQGVWNEVFALALGITKDDNGFLLELASYGIKSQAMIHRLLGYVAELSAETLWSVISVSPDRARWHVRMEALQKAPQVATDASCIDFSIRYALTVSEDLGKGGGRYNGSDLWFAVWILETVARRTDEEGTRAKALVAARDVYAQHQKDKRSSVMQAISDQWRRIPVGEQLLGTPVDESERSTNEGQHTMTLLAPFDMQSVPVTNHMYEQFDPAHASECDPLCGPLEDQGQHPVYNISAFESMAFAAWLDCRLPTSCEWEYACRAGTNTKYWSGDFDADLLRVAWINLKGDPGTSIPPSTTPFGILMLSTLPQIDRATDVEQDFVVGTHQVGQKPANPYGLHDMHGGIWERCLDVLVRSNIEPPDLKDFEHDPNVDTYIEDLTPYRVVRGGSWWVSPPACRSGYRNSSVPLTNRTTDAGFRLIRVPK